MSTRLNLMVDDDVPGMLLELADSPRKQGEYVSGLVRAAHQGQRSMNEGNDIESLRYQLATVIGKQKEVEGRVLQLERQLAAVMAGRE